MKIAIAIVLVLAAYAFAATYTLSSISGSSIKMTINTPSATTTAHNLTMVATWAAAYKQTTAQWLYVMCAKAAAANYSLTAATAYSGFGYAIKCVEATTGAGCTNAVGTLTESFTSNSITYASDTSLTSYTTSSVTSVAGTAVKTTTSFTDTSTIATAVTGLPLANATTAAYYVCWSNMDSTIDIGTAATSAVTVGNRYNVTIGSAFNSLSLTGLAIASAAIVSLF